MTNAHVIFCTCPDQATAEKIAHALVEKQLAACVNILPHVTSVYQWQGQVESAAEYLLMIKSPVQSYTAIETAIRSLHPYELPEIIALSIAQGLPEYINWIQTCHASH
ncbi:MAG: divalent-cation tolerance protein CutA [Gammaproteobacteria bacterium]|nr:divalent-cation tolerance protein CutA [Gammaproteobacteria bacterium]